MSTMTTSWCSTCQSTKAVDEFHKNRATKTGCHPSCKECRKGERLKRLPKYQEYQREWCQRNRDKQHGYAAAQYSSFRSYLAARKDVPCECGTEYPGEPYLMDFHHRDPTTKELTIGKAPRAARAAIDIEIDKCGVLRVICHRRRHAAASQEVRPVANAVETNDHQIT